MKNILTENKLVKNLRAYPVLHKRWRDYIQGVRELPEGFTAEQLFHDYLKVRHRRPLPTRLRRWRAVIPWMRLACA